MRAIRRLLVIMLATGIVAVAPSSASASVTLDGSFSTVIVKKNFTSHCPSGVADECGTMQLVGLGAADWAYAFGPTFEPDGRCFDVDGTLTITLQSDASTTSGPLTGLFCPRPSETGQEHSGAVSYGGRFFEDDSIAFGGGTGQFAGLSGPASFHTFGAGARFTGTRERHPQRLTICARPPPASFGSPSLTIDRSAEPRPRAPVASATDDPQASRQGRDVTRASVGRSVGPGREARGVSVVLCAST